MIAISGTNLRMDLGTQTEGGLYTFGTISSGTIPTTANLFAPNCKIIDLSTGYAYTNGGTAAAPVWAIAGNLVATVSLAAADLFGMYAAPVVIVPAVLGKAIIVDAFELVMTRTSTAFANGGVVGLQYDSTVHGAGTLVGANFASTVVTGATGTTYSARIPVVQSDIASASISGKGLYLSNATGAFDTGTGSAVVTVRYHLV